MLFIYFYIWVCVALCLLEFSCVPRTVHEWKRGPVVKGWQWCHTSFALNEYLIKTLPFKSLTKALVLQSFQIQCSSWWWGAKQSVLFADCCLFLFSLSLFFFLPLFTPVSPPLHLFVFVLSVLSYCECFYSAGKHLLCPLWWPPVLFLFVFKGKEMICCISLSLLLPLNFFFFLVACKWFWAQWHRKSKVFWECEIFMVICLLWEESRGPGL